MIEKGSMNKLRIFLIAFLVILGFVNQVHAQDTANPNTYFDMNTLSEIIKSSPTTPHEQNVTLVKDFFSSAGFVMDANTIARIERNAQIYRDIFRDMQNKFMIGHPRATEIIEPKYNVTTPPNKEFLSALMEYYSTNLQVVFEIGKKALNVDKLNGRDQAQNLALFYYACLQSMAVGRSQERETSCYAPLEPYLNPNLVERQKYELAYINVFRISIFQFPAVSETKEHFLSAPNTRHPVTIYKDETKMSEYDRGFTVADMQKFSLWERDDLEVIPACIKIRQIMTGIKAIYSSQYPCYNKGWFFGSDFCGQDSTENMRRISVNYLTSLDFPKVHVYDRKYRDEDSEISTRRYFGLRSACPNEIKPWGEL